ncbi:helix-turn-helix transcriptional regulator [Croceibacter atlanticus]|uniref:helix-turn-helix domain-containing protein n=1 Tax=Croceibacter atlanticus TaxID=313588 RepID=UPI0030FC0CB8
MSKATETQFDFIDDILEEISPREMKKIEQRMKNAIRIKNAMNAKGWNNKRLLNELGMKSPSVVTKWLSGTHNFTQDTLVDIGDALDIDFFSEKEPKVNVTCYLQNDTKGFDSLSSLDYIRNSHNMSVAVNANGVQLHAKA